MPMKHVRFPRPRPARTAAQRGMALIEALIAILILAVGLIGTLGLQVNSQKALSQASMRAEATIAANELIGVMNTDLDNLDGYALADDGEPKPRLQAWHKALTDHLPNAAATIAVTPVPDTERTEVAIDISWQRDAEAPRDQHRVLTYIARSE